MPRQNKPQKHRTRNCWKFTFCKQTHYFGHDIPYNERPMKAGVPERAWDAMNEIIRRESARTVDLSDPTVYGLAQYYLQWAEGEVDHDRMAMANYRAHCTHLEKFWSFRGHGDRLARTMAIADLDLFCREMRETETERKTPHSPAYIANLCRSIQAAFNWAARTVPDRVPPRLIPENPLSGHRPPPVPHQERYVDAKLARTFLRWVWGRAKGRGGVIGRFDRITVLLLQFLRMTGARPGEACVLLWTDIRWKEGVIIIPPERHKTGKKTGKSREIQITPPVARLLRAIERFPGHHPDHVFTHKLGKNARSLDAVSEHGRPWNSVTLSAKVRSWRDEVIAAGIPIEATGEKRFVNYIFRHTYATDAIQSGLTHAETAELIGNTAQVTEKRYVHVQRKHSRRRAEHVVERRRSSD